MKRRVVLAIGIAVAVVFITILVITISLGGSALNAGPTPDPSGSPTVTPSVPPSPAPTPASTSAPGTVGADGAALVLPFLAAEATVREAPQPTIALDEVATGQALADLQVGAIEFVENGLTQVGAPTVVSATVTQVDDSAAVPTTTVLVCLDYSAVDVVGPDGKSLKSKDAPERVPTLLTLTQSGSQWLVSERTFPDETTC